MPVIETATVMPSSETLTYTSTPTVPAVRPKEVSVNCRQGPGLEWEAIGGLNVGASAQIVGKSSDLEWWYIVNPNNSNEKCWVMVKFTSAEGNLTNIPIVPSP
jgi:uncharacterized protein YraI